MELLQPNSLDSLGTMTLQIVDHSSKKEFSLTLASFETILSLKQAISLHYEKDFSYLPNFLFLATKLNDSHYKPIEFEYTKLENVFPDPFVSVPDKRFINEAGTITKQSYVSHKYDTLETYNFSIIHLWTAASIVATLSDRANPFQFKGRVSVYFPWIQSYITLNPPNKDEISSIIKKRQSSLYETYKQIDSSLHDKLLQQTIQSVQLTLIHKFHAQLPGLPSISSDGIYDIFYNMKTSRHLPFIRYFSRGVVPILKIASGPGGIPFITDVTVLKVFLADKPDSDESCIMIKVPIELPNIRIVQKGYSWTFLLYESGHTEVRLDEIKAGEPITFSLIARAFEILPKILELIGWKSDILSQIKLSYFSGVYSITLNSATNEEYNIDELRKRISMYKSFLFEKGMEKKQINLRWMLSPLGDLSIFKNIVQRTIYLYRNHSEKETYTNILNQYGISRTEIEPEITQYKNIMTDLATSKTDIPDEQLGASIVLTMNYPTFTMNVEHIHSSNELNLFMTIIQLLISNKKIEKTLVVKNESEEEEEEEEEEESNDFPSNDFPSNDAVPEEKSTKVLTEADMKFKDEKYEYLSDLEKADVELFKYTSTTEKGYSTKCQKPQQPYVLEPSKYKNIKKLYEDRVNLIEYPISKDKYYILEFINKSVGERKKVSTKKPDGFTDAEKVKMEIDGLKMGFPLKSNQSFLKEKAPKELKDLIETHAKKEVWVVARAGSMSPNYYICSKYWCATDKMPILLEDYTSPTMYNGKYKKIVPSCPFCGEQNVYKREGHIYAGYSDKYEHPKKYVLPCCFKTFTKLNIPLDSLAIPSEKGDTLTVETIEPTESIYYAPKKQITIEKELTIKKIYSTHILSSGSGSFPLEYGTYGILPPQMDKLLGQSSTKYQETIGSKIKLLEEPNAFIRFGCITNKLLKGQSFLEFLSYIIYVSHQMGDGIGIKDYLCPHELIEWMCVTNRVKMARAFEAANYGTLVIEFYDRGEPDVGQEGSSYTIEEFQTWMTEMNLAKMDRAYVMRFFKAWHRFTNYIRDLHEEKELRIWDGLLSTPGLFSKKGILILRIARTSKDDINPQIECSPLGVSLRSRKTDPSILPICYTKDLSIIEPLLYIKNEKTYYGTILPSVIEKDNKLKKLYNQYLEPTVGCGRTIEPIHIWAIPDTATVPIPALGAFLDFLRKDKQYKIISIFREYTNRVFGVLFEQAKIKYYIPVTDDGTIDITIPSIYDSDSMPTPPIESLYSLLITLSAHFPYLEPINLRYTIDKSTGKKTYVAIYIKAKFQILFEPYEEGTKENILKTATLIGSFQWENDKLLLKKADKLSIDLMNQIYINPVELLEEAYQHLRISFSNWLHRTKEGTATLKQIELLRAARSYLPLYELRKRGDILLAGLVESWITKEGTDKEPKLLREDCLLLETDKCNGMCAPVDGSCKIHVPNLYGKFDNPAKVLSAQLIDELLRTNESAYEVLKKEHHRVERLRPPTEITKEGDTVIVSFDGRGDDSLYRRLGLKGRLPTAYTSGIIYPEEVSAERLGQEVGTETGLPFLWEENGWSRSVESHELKEEDSKLVKQTILTKLLQDINMTYIEFETSFHKIHPGEFTWSASDVKILSKLLDINIVLTERISQTGTLKVSDIIKSKKENNYLLFDENNFPLQFYNGTHTIYSVSFDDLPLDVQSAIEIRS